MKVRGKYTDKKNNSDLVYSLFFPFYLFMILSILNTQQFRKDQISSKMYDIEKMLKAIY